jgi:ribose transport system substrate-binding protein
MRKTKILILVLLGLAFGIVIGGWLRSTPAKSETVVVKERHYVFNGGLMAQPFWKEVISAIKQMTAATPGLKIDFGGPADLDPGKQIEELEAIIESKPDGIVVFATDPKSLGPTINKAMAQGIPVVTMWADVASSKRMTFISAPEKESAEQLIQKALADHPELLSQKTKVLVSLPAPGMTSTDERLEGVKEVLTNYPSLELTQVVSDEASDVKATEAISAALQRNPDIKIIFGLDARSAIGAISALKERGAKKGEVVVTGWDGDEDVLRGIQEGWIHSTSILNISLSIQTAFSILESAHLGYLYPTILQLKEKNLPTLPSRLEIPEVLVNQKNVAGYFHKK